MTSGTSNFAGMDNTSSSRDCCIRTGAYGSQWNTSWLSCCEGQSSPIMFWFHPIFYSFARGSWYLTKSDLPRPPGMVSMFWAHTFEVQPQLNTCLFASIINLVNCWQTQFRSKWSHHHYKSNAIKLLTLNISFHLTRTCMNNWRCSRWTNLHWEWYENLTPNLISNVHLQRFWFLYESYGCRHSVTWRQSTRMTDHMRSTPSSQGEKSRGFHV